MLASTMPPAQDSRGFGNSARVWLGCVAFLIVVELYIVLIGGGLDKDPRTGLFSPLSIAAFGVAGFVGIWLSHRTGFPAAWDTRIRPRSRCGHGLRHRLRFEFRPSGHVPEIRISRGDRDPRFRLCRLARDLRQLHLRVLNVDAASYRWS